MTAIVKLAGRGEAAHDDTARTFARKVAPNLAPIRYADPVAWAVTAAIARALDPLEHVVAQAHDRAGVVVTSADGPTEAITSIREASQRGTSSPVRFPAANAGSLAGLASIAFAFRGPTLVLTLPPSRGVPVALLLAEAWVRRGVASFVALAACSRTTTRCLLVGEEGTPLDAERDVAWLLEVP
jgi:hypothetical protein